MSVIYPYEDWSKNDYHPNKITNPVRTVVVHHAEAPESDAGSYYEEDVAIARAIEHWHTNGNGWDAVGYNFLIFQSGRVLEGRGFGHKGAHEPLANRESIGVCFVIDGRKTKPTYVALASFRELVDEAIERGYLHPQYKLRGHCDYSETECPGEKLYDLLPYLKERPNGELHGED